MVGLCADEDEAKLLTRRGNDLVTAHETRFIETERARREADELGVRFVGGVFDLALADDLHGVATSRGPVRRFNFAGKATIFGSKISNTPCSEKWGPDLISRGDKMGHGLH